MIPAMTGALLPVLAGIGLARSPWLRARLARPVRVAAVVLAAAVVLGVLLPQSWRAMGPTALLVFAAATALPIALERLGRRTAPEAEEAAVLLGVELGFLGLFAHQLVEGAEIGAAWRLETGAGWLTLAVAAHTVPLVALVIDGVDRRGGARSSLGHGLLLLLASGAGAAAGHAGIEALSGSAGWLPAVVGGLLAHLILHEGAHGHGGTHDHHH